MASRTTTQDSNHQPARKQGATRNADKAKTAAARTSQQKDETPGGEMSVREAGRKGGRTTSEEVRKGELPRDFYQQIGHKGGEAVKQEVASGELPKDHYSRIGHLGGQKVKELIEKGKGST